MENDYTPYDPLDYQNLTINLVRELMTRGPFNLPITEVFEGPGIYALFYTGDFDPYSSISSKSAERPIYVGKAEPPGGRTGGVQLDPKSPALSKRLKEHCQSIEQVDSLAVSDFTCRYLVVVPLWIKMAERFLIEHYTPLWNSCLDGFGNHNPGKGRLEGEISWWDALHPGRSWAAKLKQSRSQKDAVERVEQFFAD